MSYFDDWGGLKNPIRQSDLSALFANRFGCAKRFYLAKAYPQENTRRSFKTAAGEVVHACIFEALRFERRLSVAGELKRRYPYLEDDASEYELMMDAFFEAKEIDYFRSRLVGHDRAFIVKVGPYHCAGTVDAIFANKQGGLTIVDWKSGYPPISQYEMDRGYQTKLYCHAMLHGEFFTWPEDMSSGRAYYEQYSAPMYEKNRYKTWPDMMYAYLRELLPAKRASRRKAAHHSTLKLADDQGMLGVEKDERRGPVFYECRTDKDMTRIEYSIASAVLMARAGIFPESLGRHCVECNYRDRCERTKPHLVRDDKQLVFGLMKELGLVAE